MKLNLRPPPAVFFVEKQSSKNVDISAFLFFMLSKMGVSRKEKL